MSAGNGRKPGFKETIVKSRMRPPAVLAGRGVRPVGNGAIKPAPKKAGKKQAEPEIDRELLIERDRLTERFTIMQADLGGAFYEMAIRDHVKLDVLTKMAAELQKVDLELEALDEKLQLARADVAENCPKCGAEAGRGASFCANCGQPLAGQVQAA